LYWDEQNDEVPAQEVEEAPEALDEPEPVVEEVPPQPVTFMEWLRGLFSGPVAQRLDSLNDAIKRHPQAALNYVLRGEIWLDRGEYEMAAADFERAQALAAEQFDEDDWGLVSQTLRDQAEHGLQRAMRKLAHHR
jgi:tetratricopeptide (TPR) repeat protein